MKPGTPTDPGRGPRENPDGGEGRWYDDIEALLRLPQPSTRAWLRAGVSPRAERILDLVGGVVLLLLSAGWVWSFVHADSALAAAQIPYRASSMSAAVARALPNRTAVSTAYLTDAALNAIVDRMLEKQRGASGRLRVALQADHAPLTVDSLPEGTELRYALEDTLAAVERPTGSGIWSVVLAVGNGIRPVADFSIIAMHPFSAKEKGRIGGYFIGNWPSERGGTGPSNAPPDRYANPRGFIEVTLENRDTRVSEHFRLRDFLTKDQPDTWPKYLVLEMRLVDKLELIMTELQRRGVDTRGVRVMSGFRTPQYNVGGGNTQGRAAMSRHMYGDAADIYIDNDGNGVIDDLNGDGKIDIGDARFMLEAVERVEAAYPELIGGTGVYRASAGHGPFIHVDTRGYRARW